MFASEFISADARRSAARARGAIDVIALLALADYDAADACSARIRADRASQARCT